MIGLHRTGNRIADRHQVCVLLLLLEPAGYLADKPFSISCLHGEEAALRFNDET
jgi:hypothetical protein